MWREKGRTGKRNQTTKRTEMKQKKESLEQMDLDLKEKMEYGQETPVGISRSFGRDVAHCFFLVTSESK